MRPVLLLLLAVLASAEEFSKKPVGPADAPDYWGGVENVPSDAWVYADIDLLKTAGLIKSMPATSRPWTREEARRLAAEAGENMGRDWRSLAPAQRAAIERLDREFELFRTSPGPREPLIRIPVKEAGGEARADLFSRATLGNKQQSGSIGAVLNNRPGDNFVFYERAEFTLRRPDWDRVTDSAGQHIIGSRVNSWMGMGRFELEQAYLAFKIPWLRLELGRDEFVWGPGWKSSAMLSDNAPALDHVQLCARYENFKFLAFTSALSRWGEKHRFFSAQRLEVSLFHRVTLGGALMAVYAWDSLQTKNFFGYMNPLTPIYLELANSGHDDNLLVGFDAVAYLPQTKVYGQLHIDNYEFVEKENKPCNALAWQAGAYWQPNWPVNARFEYARVNPFTYYHRIYHIMYENYGTPLGHELGPDADRIDARIGYTPIERLNVGLFGQYTRRGYYNRGDFERKTWHGGQPIPVKFPAEENGEKVELTSRAGLDLEFWLWRDMRALGSVSAWQARNRAGVPDATDRGLDFELKLEYRY